MTMKLRLRHTWRLLLKELSAFGVVGAINFALDVGIFQVMYDVFGVGALVAKIISTSITTTTAYFMHRHWSFSHRARTGVKREYPIFFFVNALTLVLSLLMLAFVHYTLGQTDTLVLQVTNIASIAIGTVIRFAAYKRWVFPLYPSGSGDIDETENQAAHESEIAG